MPADLHIHSSFSDGTNSPEELVQLAKDVGLTTISITDHDGISGIERAVNYGEKSGVNVVSGIEFTTENPKTEVHILGYFLDIKNSSLLEFIKKVQDSRKERIYKIVNKLCDLGAKIEALDVFSIAGNDCPGRPHVAKALLNKGIVSSIKEAFVRFLDFRGPAYVNHMKISPKDAINIIRQAKGLSVYAHPGASNCDEIIVDLVASGLAGIEVFYPTHSYEQLKRYKNFANKYNLVMTGGSDFHGSESGRPIRLGETVMTDELMEKLKLKYEYLCRN